MNSQWLDKVETMIQSLASKTNVDAIEEELAAYEKSERDAIINHQAARSRAVHACLRRAVGGSRGTQPATACLLHSWHAHGL